MKTIYLTLTLALACSQAFAQGMKKLDYINPAQVTGVYNLGMHSAVLSNEGNRGMDKKDIYTLHFMDETIPVQEFAVNQRSTLFAVESSKENSVFIFNGQKELSLVYVRPNGNPSISLIESPANYQFHSLYESGMNHDGSLTLFRGYTKLGKDRQMRDSVIESGLEFITVNSGGKVINTRYEKRSTYTSDNVVSIFPTSNGMAYVMESNSPKKKEYALNLVFSDKMGKVTGSFLLSEANTLFPTEVIADNGQYVVAGYYLKGTIYSAKKTEGLFIQVLKPDGGLIATNTYDWDNLKGKLKGNQQGDYLFNGKMNIMVESISATDNGYRIICESYSYGSGVTPAEFLIGDNSSSSSVVSVYDFVVFETGKSGDVTSVNILKTEPCNIDVGPRLGSRGSLQVSNLLKRYQIFPYKSLNGNKIQYVRYKKGEGFYAEIDVLTGEITDGKPVLLKPVIVEEVDEDYEALKEKSKTIDKLDRFSKRLDNFSEKVDEVGTNAQYGIEKIDRYFNPYERMNSGLFILEDKKVITYLISPESFAIYYELLN